MKLQIDFYSRDEVSVFIESKPGEIDDENAFEPFLFAWFTLRQLHNLGHNKIVDAFIGLLTRNQNVTKLMKEPPEIPSVVDLLLRANSVMFDDVKRVDPQMDMLSRIGILKGEVSPTTGLTSDEYFALRSRFEEDHAINIIERDYLKGFPRIVDYRGNPANKRFVAMIGFDQKKGRQYFNLQPEGFGVLGLHINYYAPHSIIALLRFLAQKRSTDEIYLKRLSSIAYLCGKAHMENKISSTNQPELALRIFNSAEQVE